MNIPTLPLHADAPWLAPLAGYTDLPFRLLCRDEGAKVACTEMVSAKGLVYGRRGGKIDSNTLDLLSSNEHDLPLVVQLFGAEAEFLREAVHILREMGFIWFDLNMGCSVPKVTKTGAGSAMLKDVENALAVGRAMIEAAGQGRVGFKLRLGWAVGEEVYLALAQELEQLGAGWISLHPRYAKQAFGGKADWSALRLLKEKLSIPVIASGDLFTARDALRCLEETGVDTVMFARGAIASPAVFRFYHALRAGESFAHEYLAAQDLFSLINRHAALAKELTPGRPGKKGYSPALLKMRTVVPRYVKHLPGARELRLRLVHCASWEELEAFLHDFFTAQEAALRMLPGLSYRFFTRTFSKTREHPIEQEQIKSSENTE